MNYWDEVHAAPIKPPAVRKQLERPKKARRKDSNEPRSTSTRKGLSMHCKRCFNVGHNSRTCKNEIHPKSKFYKDPSKVGGESQATSSSAMCSQATQTDP